VKESDGRDREDIDDVAVEVDLTCELDATPGKRS
jgi:hypothetical protein